MNGFISIFNYFQFCFVYIFFLEEAEINNDVVHRIGDCYSEGVELLINFSVSYECIVIHRLYQKPFYHRLHHYNQ